MPWWGNLYQIIGKQSDVRVDEIIIHTDLDGAEREIGEEDGNGCREWNPNFIWSLSSERCPLFLSPRGREHGDAGITWNINVGCQCMDLVLSLCFLDLQDFSYDLHLFE